MEQLKYWLAGIVLAGLVIFAALETLRKALFEDPEMLVVPAGLVVVYIAYRYFKRSTKLPWNN
jgi:uncharacterized membrane protein YoaK (UPF0700 family)